MVWEENTRQNTHGLHSIYSTFHILLLITVWKIFTKMQKRSTPHLFSCFLEVCSDAMFRISPMALPRPQPPPVSFGDSVFASPNSEAWQIDGVGGGVRGMWSTSLSVCQGKTKLGLGVFSGVPGGVSALSMSLLDPFKPIGRLSRHLDRVDSLE